MSEFNRWIVCINDIDGVKNTKVICVDENKYKNKSDREILLDYCKDDNKNLVVVIHGTKESVEFDFN